MAYQANVFLRSHARHVSGMTYTQAVWVEDDEDEDDNVQRGLD